MPKTEHIKRKNSKAVLAEINKLDIINYDTVAQILPLLLKEGSLKLDTSVYTPADNATYNAQGLNRYLVYDNPDSSNPFSIWVFAFNSQQKTSIHDHKYKGSVTVIDGEVTEKYYKPIDNTQAISQGRIDMYTFFTSRDDFKQPFVHQLKRCKSLGLGSSATLHIYNMPAHDINDKGDQIDRRNLDRLYTKFKEQDENSPSPSLN